METAATKTQATNLRVGDVIDTANGRHTVTAIESTTLWSQARGRATKRHALRLSFDDGTEKVTFGVKKFTVVGR